MIRNSSLAAILFAAFALLFVGLPGSYAAEDDQNYGTVIGIVSPLSNLNDLEIADIR